MRRFGTAPALLAALAASLAACDSAGITCTDDDTRPECLPGSFQVQPQGSRDAALPLEEALGSLQPAESTTFVAGSGAAPATLSNGFRMEVPDGAFPAGTTVDVFRYDLDDPVYRFVSAAQPAVPVRLVLPVAGLSADAGPDDAFLAWFHGGDAVPSLLGGTVDGAAGTLAVDVDRFSTGVAPRASPVPVMIGDRLVKAPYYNQGATQNCWSMSLTMLLNAYGANVEPWEVNAFFGIGAEDGQSYWTYQWFPGLKDFIAGKVGSGVGIERLSWWTTGGADKVRRYLETTLRQGRPVMTWYYAPGTHMVLFVGIEGNDFVIHDPGSGAYQVVPWSAVAPRFSQTGFDGTGTLALLPPAPAPRWTASLLVPFVAAHGNGIDFMALRPDGQFDVATTLVWSWFVPALKGPGLLNVATGLPGTLTSKHRAFATVRVANLDRGSPRTFQVGFEITNTAGGQVYRHPEATVTLQGGQDKDVRLVTQPRGIPVKDLVSAEGSYQVTFYVSDGGVRQDTATIPFVVKIPAEPVSACSALTKRFRGACGVSGGCMCIGNAFCEGMAEKGIQACEDLQRNCAFDCLFSDDGTCECGRYCNLYLAEAGCPGLESGD